jgi:uncharacterized protein YdcH (DUF465 family)
MTVEHHALILDLPEYRDEIHALKTSDAHFARLFDEYHDITKQVELMEAEVTPASTQAEESLKLKRVQLKDQMYAMIKEQSATA